MTTAQDYYTTHSPITVPDGQAALLDGLPASVDELRCVVQGLLLHVFWAERYGVKLSPERQDEVQLRWVSRQLARIVELDPRPMPEARPPERRLVGNCRDFSVLLAALLRHTGTPARARCGFGRYFLPNHYEDHWVCEVWNAAQGRWALVDAQLDALQCQAMGITFDPLDVPRDQFITGGLAWQMCRAGQADPETFGFRDMHGLWFVRGDFVRDVAALNKMELLPWDVWGLMERRDDELDANDLALLDHLANLTAGDVPNVDEVRRLYEANAGWRVPPIIHSWVAGEPRAVEVG